ncbi:MAG TPA: nucleotidyltransferase family protein [Solirubrobacteraceae bacterium]|nr:nucleotidyltransferase family protein [Solirubrobacteraceae bacterium]
MTAGPGGEAAGAGAARAGVAGGGPAAGLVLAAGAGTRFGTAPKQLARLGDRPLLQWAIDAQTAVDPALLDPVVVVLGSHAAEIRAAIDLGRAVAVVCPDWEAGQSASLRCGLQAIGDADRVVVTLGDAPFVSSELIARFAGDGEPTPARAVYDARPGHPVALGREQIAALRAAGPDRDEGARGLLRGARTVEAGHLCSGRDVDTREDLEEVRDEARAVI